MRMRGIRVRVENTRPDIETAFVLDRLDAALALIEHYQPWRLSHLRRDIAYLQIAAFPCRGAYFPGERMVLTELSFLAREAEFTPAIIASSIVHEGVHARVDRMTSSPRDPAREERLCRRAELAFGQSLPTALGAPVIERAVASLGLDDADVAPTIDWAAARAVKAQADAQAIAAWRSRS
jgi:hypothetical protein